jgi:hypothetical protein
MSFEVTTGAIKSSLKETLDTIVDDDLAGSASRMVLPKWMKMETMGDAWVDDVEYGGGGNVAKKPEGMEFQPITMREGPITRYLAETFGACMVITEEAQEDCKYKDVIRLALRLERSMYKTIDIDGSLRLMRATDTGYVGGDGLCLANSAHTLPYGGSFSNTLATPLSPSVELINTVWTALQTMPGHDGQIEGYEVKKVVYPPAQHWAWLTILGSKMNPEAGNFAAINPAGPGGEFDITPVCNKFWQNTTTNSGFITDAGNGLQFKYRVKPSGRSWAENNNTLMKFAIRARWACKWSDARGYFHNNA